MQKEKSFVVNLQKTMIKNPLIKAFCFAAILLLPTVNAHAQHSYGSTGLLRMPSAMMQEDKTFMIGSNYMPQESLPYVWKYNSYNYFLNFTLFPFLEISYTCTLFKMKYPENKQFNNQDRFFSARLRLLKEGKYYPSVVIGANDFASTLTHKQLKIKETGNGYFNRYYLALSKNFQIKKENLSVHLAYLYNNRKYDKLNGVAVGVDYAPSFLPHFDLMAEFDSKDFNIGCNYLLAKHYNFFFQLYDMHIPCGGFSFIYTIR